MNKALFAILLAGVLQSCAAPTDLYRVSSIRWSGDSIKVQVVDKQDPPRPVAALETTFECMNCNLYLEPWVRELEQDGSTTFMLPEARFLVSPRIRVMAHGIDTPAVIYQRSPDEASQFYRLQKPLTGRVLLTGLAILYYDAEYDLVATSVDIQDELNIYSEESEHYLVHHPNFPQPLYLRKLGVVRMR